VNLLPASLLVDTDGAGRPSTTVSVHVEDRRIVASGRHFTMNERADRISPLVWIAMLPDRRRPNDRRAARTTAEDVPS